MDRGHPVSAQLPGDQTGARIKRKQYEGLRKKSLQTYSK